MKALIFAIGLTAASAAVAGPRVEQNLPKGSLGVAALDSGDYATAESQIVGVGESLQDPAKLINLGHVYLRTGRAKEAISAWQQALASPDHYQVISGDGQVRDTSEIARAAIERYRYAARAQ